ncbi:MAG: hypothetical protein ACRDI3_05850 [Actinomycetota bacterium]
MLWAGPIEFSGPELFLIFLVVVVLPALVIGLVAFVIFKGARQLIRDRAESKRRRAEADAKLDDVLGKETDDRRPGNSSEGGTR